jgi:hypothetical protein
MLQELKVAIRIHTFEKRNPTSIYPKNFHSALATARSNSFRIENPVSPSGGVASSAQRMNRSNSVSASSAQTYSTLSTKSTSNNNVARSNSFRLNRAASISSDPSPGQLGKLQMQSEADNHIQSNIQRGDLLSEAINELLNSNSATGVVSLNDVLVGSRTT